MAPHAIGAHLKGDPKAVAVLAAAGRQALAAGAAATAAEHFQAALDLAGAFADPGLQLEFARACLLTGKVDLALDCLGRLLGRDDLTDKDRVAGARLQARVLIASARHTEAKQRFEEASDLAARSDVDLAAEIMLDAAPTASQALRKAAFHAEVNLACIGGDPSDLDVMAAAARADLEVHNHTPPWPRPPWGGDLVFGYTGLARISERFDDCLEMVGALMDESRSHGATLSYQTLAISHADTLWRLGRLAEARALLVEAAELADLVPTLAPLAWVGLAYNCHEQGAQEESSGWAARVGATLVRGGEPSYLRLWLC